MMATSTKGYVDTEYLRIVAELLEKPKRQTYLPMQIEKGDKVLDVGCGPGTDTLALAELVGPTGEVYGVDFDGAMVAEAELRAEKARVNGWVHHKEADATAMPFASGSFDACRSERVFQHSLNPRAILAEMVRVTKKDGWVVVLDSDWGSLGVDTDEVEIERRLMSFSATETHHNGVSGRCLYRFFKEQGLTDISVELLPIVITSYPLMSLIYTFGEKERQALAAKIVTTDEIQRWRASLERAEANGTFFAYFCMALVAGCKS